MLIFNVYVNLFIFLIAAIVFRVQNPVIYNAEVLENERFYRSAGYYDDETLNQPINFARRCSWFSAYQIGLVDAKGVDMIDGRYPSDLIFDVLKSKLGKETKFRDERYLNEAALETYYLSDDNLTKDRICFGLVVNQYDTANKRYNISIRYGPKDQMMLLWRN